MMSHHHRWREVDVAVKQLIEVGNFTQKDYDEFYKEVNLLQNLRPHPFVVMFLGITVPSDPLSLVRCQSVILTQLTPVGHRIVRWW